MAAHGCHFVECSLYVRLVIIERFFLAVRDSGVARTLLYKVSIAIVSRSFYRKKRVASASIPIGSPQLPVIHRAPISPDILELVVPDWTERVVAAILSNNQAHYA